MSHPLFLVHYTPDDDAVYVRQVFADLQAAVFGRLGTKSANAGWLAEAGGHPETTPYTDGLAGTSATMLACRVLVVLYSRAYLRDKTCLLEWSLFRERVRWHHRLTGRSTPALIGVRWSLWPGSEESTIVADDVLRGDFGPCYDDGGVLRLLRKYPASAAYEKIIQRIAELVVFASADPPPPISEKNLKYLSFPLQPSAAGGGVRPVTSAALLTISSQRGASETPGRHGLGEPGWATSRGGADQGGPVPTSSVGIVLAAAAAADLPAQRVARDYYGESVTDWRPFRPHDARPVVKIVSNALARYAFPDADVYPLQPETLARLDDASQKQILLLLVDPWSALSDADAQLLRRFRDWQARRPAVAGALVVFATSDDETTQASGALRDRLRVSMEYSFGDEVAGGYRLSGEVRTADQLARSAVRLVTRAWNAFLPARAAARAGGSGVPAGDYAPWQLPTAGDTRDAVPGRTAEERP
jgi:FxsC-like protein